MTKKHSRKISEPRSNKSLLVPTLLSNALLSAFSSSAIAANRGGGGFLDYSDFTIGGTNFGAK